MRRGELQSRLDAQFYVTDPNLPEGANFPTTFPIKKLENISSRIIQPNEFIREYVEDSGNSVALLRAANVLDGELNTDDLVFVAKEKLSRARDGYADSYLQEGDILITRTGAKAGATSLVRKLQRPFIISSHSIRVVPKQDLIDAAYLELFLLSRWGKAQINRLFTGAAQKQLQLATVAKLEICLPPLDIQRALVAEMEAARESRRAKLNQADELLKSFDGWLLSQLGLEPPPTDSRRAFAVRLGDVRGRIDPYFYQPRFEKVLRALTASRYPLQTIGSICESPVGGATPLRGDAELYDQDGVKFLRILNVKPNNIDLTDVKYIRDSVHNGELSRSQLATNDVLMTITGRVGTAAVVPEEILPANINQHIVRLRIASNNCLPAYLAAYLNTSVGLAVSNRSVTGGTRIALDYQAIRSLPVSLPPKDIQKTIIEALNERRTEAHRSRAEAEAEWQAAKERFEHQLLTGG